MTDFTGKAIIITGGGKGIGRAVCLAFAAAGANVLCADVDDPAGQEVVTAAASAPGAIVYQNADVATSAACKGLVDQAVAAWGGVDVLINNVGIQPLNSYLPAHELPEEMWDRIINVNLKSGFLMTKYAAPVMAARGGGHQSRHNRDTSGRGRHGQRLREAAPGRGQSPSAGAHWQAGRDRIGDALSCQRRCLLYDRRICQCGRRPDGKGRLGRIINIGYWIFGRDDTGQPKGISNTQYLLSNQRTLEG
jgi:NAD(P)-dependent dehydrogenase (short-subunit alcohol dehydrogenase family)